MGVENEFIKYVNAMDFGWLGGGRLSVRNNTGNTNMIRLFMTTYETVICSVNMNDPPCW